MILLINFLSLEIKIHKIKEKIDRKKAETVGLKLPEERVNWDAPFRNISADTLFSIEDTNESSIIAAAQAGQTGYILDIRDRFDTNIAHIDPSGKLHYQSSFSPISNEGTASSFTFNLDKSKL